MSPYYHVEEELFHALHPFSLVTNAHGYITLLGRSLVKLFPQARLGAHYSQVCDILSPSGPGTPIDLAGLVGELIVLGVPGSNQPSARGQILQVFSPEHCFIFSLHPALNDTKRLVELRLDLSDFEMAAPLFDFLLVMRSMEVVNEKLRRANDSLQFDLAMSRVLREIITVLFRVEKTEDVYVKALNLVCAELKWDLAHVEYEVVDPQYSAPVDIWSFIRQLG
jgi:hypothetical protein